MSALQDTHGESNGGEETGEKRPCLVFQERTNTICKHFFSALSFPSLQSGTEKQASTTNRKSLGSDDTGDLAHTDYQSTLKLNIHTGEGFEGLNCLEPKSFKKNDKPRKKQSNLS